MPPVSNNQNHKLKSISLLILLIFLLGCHQQKPAPTTKQTVQRLSVSDEQPPLTSFQKGIIKDAFQLFEAFPVDRVVRLKHRDDIIIGMVNQACVVANHIAVLDTSQRQVFLFSQEGDLLQRVGRPGGGPGEYGFPSHIQTLWNQDLAVLDNQGKLLIYDSDGNYRTTLLKTQGFVIPRSKFLWPEPDRFYAFAFNGDRDDAMIQVMDYSDLKNPKPRYSFDDRPNFLDKFGFTLGYEAFTMVGDQLWTSNPFKPNIDVWDQAGNHIKSISLGREMADLEYFREMAEKHGSRYLGNRERITRLVQVGNVVLVGTSKGYQVLDHEGTKLSGLMPITFRYAGTYQNQLITVLEGGDRASSESVYASGLNPEYKLMVEEGYDMDAGLDEYYLRFGSLIQDP